MSVEVKNLSFSYRARSVLTNVSFTAERGRLLSVLGPNGVGKSTLFRCILGLLKGYTGQILVDGADAKSLTARELARAVAYIPQSSYPAFSYSVHDMVLMGTQSRFSPFSPRDGRESGWLPRRWSVWASKAWPTGRIPSSRWASGSWSSSPVPWPSSPPFSSWTSPPPIWTTGIRCGSSPKSAP